MSAWLVEAGLPEVPWSHQKFSDGALHEDYERGVLPLEVSETTVSRYLGAFFFAH
jgi:hypothetical protein